jgi:hypothetical protein
MEGSPVRVVGTLRKTPWERFDRLQRTAARLRPASAGQPKGVFRFRRHEDLDLWTANLRRRN